MRYIHIFTFLYYSVDVQFYRTDPGFIAYVILELWLRKTIQSCKYPCWDLGQGQRRWGPNPSLAGGGTGSTVRALGDRYLQRVEGPAPCFHSTQRQQVLKHERFP